MASSSWEGALNCPSSSLPTSPAEAAPVRALRNCLQHSGRYLLAVSGGLDSMVLLHGTLILRSELSLQLAVCHVDHGVRSDTERDFSIIQNLAQRFGVETVRAHLPTCPVGENFEGWARGQRYQIFRNCLLHFGLDTVLTAHHQDDNLETFLMRLLSNKELTRIQAWNPKTRSLRPFLSLGRKELSHYAKQNNVCFNEDKTNLDPRFLRNRIRNELIPLIQSSFGEPSVSALIRQSAECEELYRALDYYGSQEARALSSYAPFGSKLWLRKFQERLEELPAAAGDRLIRESFEPI
ncbi:MAG: tRNA lysidine(34) synthetase TilS, partial [Bdellovibrionales bacterium]|nr:tRNA lysidine(34) synthetase TilS [Bdellovibrionales bacterium]